MNSVTALTSALSDYFSLKTSYEIKYDHEPVPATLKKTDTILALTLVVSF
jgi:putative salt-induced outer membrane protein YdiY